MEDDVRLSELWEFCRISREPKENSCVQRNLLQPGPSLAAAIKCFSAGNERLKSCWNHSEGNTPLMCRNSKKSEQQKELIINIPHLLRHETVR